MFYHMDGHKYFFLHGNYVNVFLNYDYKKLNLQIVNNFNEKSEGFFVSYDSTQTYNVFYNYYNLQYETEQIEYNFKTCDWRTFLLSYILSFYYFLNKDANEYIIQIENISNDH